MTIGFTLFELAAVPVRKPIAAGIAESAKATVRSDSRVVKRPPRPPRPPRR